MSTPLWDKTAAYGLIEWDGSYTPTLIMGCCADAVQRTAVRILAQTDAGGGAIAADDPDFLTHHPLPDLADADADICGWLEALREATTQPWFTLLDATEIVHKGDDTLLLDWTSAIPCTSRPGTHDTGTTGDARPTPQPQASPRAALPRVVNGYPVVTAIAQGEGEDSWIVICRRTEQADRPGDQPWYVTWRVWWADGAYHVENGDYGPHHGLTWPQAQRSLLRRLGYRHSQAAAWHNKERGAIALTETDTAYEAYVACFDRPTLALLDLAHRAGAAVAYIDRYYIETERDGPLTDEQWEAVAAQLDWYDEHVSYSDSNSLFLDQVFAKAGVPRYPDEQDQ